MRVWGPCLQVMAEPVAVTKNELKKRRKRVMQLFKYWRDVFWGGLSEAGGKEQVARRKKGKQLFDYWQKVSWGRTGRG